MLWSFQILLSHSFLKTYFSPIDVKFVYFLKMNEMMKWKICKVTAKYGIYELISNTSKSENITT